MRFLVLINGNKKDGYTAEVSHFPHIKSTGATFGDAVSNISASIKKTITVVDDEVITTNAQGIADLIRLSASRGEDDTYIFLKVDFDKSVYK